MLRLIALLTLLLLSQVAMALTYTLAISEAEIQEKVASMMPIERKRFFVTAIFSHPKIELAEKANEVGIHSQIDIKALGGIESTGKTKITGTLSYDKNKAEFYFKNPVVVNLAFDKMPASYLPILKNIVQLVITKLLSSTPIYKLKGGDLKHDLTKTMIKSVTVENKQLLVELELF